MGEVIHLFLIFNSTTFLFPNLYVTVLKMFSKSISIYSIFLNTLSSFIINFFFSKPALITSVINLYMQCLSCKWHFEFLNENLIIPDDILRNLINPAVKVRVGQNVLVLFFFLLLVLQWDVIRLTAIVMYVKILVLQWFVIGKEAIDIEFHRLMVILIVVKTQFAVLHIYVLVATLIGCWRALSGYV